MNEGNSSGGFSKSRPVLGDLTNRMGKRGLSEVEKIRIKSFDFNNKDSVKRICVSPRPCTEIHSLKGNVISGISKIPDENRDPAYAVSKNSIDCDGANCLKRKDVVKGNSKTRDENKDVKILDLIGGDAVLQSGTELDVVQRMDDDKEHLTSIATEADGCGKLEQLKDKVILGISEVVNDNSVGKDAVDLTIISGSEPAQGSSKICNEENDPNSLDIGKSHPIQSMNIEANDELSDSFPANTSRTVSESGDHCLEGTQRDMNYCHINDVEDHNGDNFVLSQSGSIDCTILPESQESRVFGLDVSTKSKEDECSDSIKSCSCSFCTKAAYIWFDLHYQDIKTRLSAIKKSQKEAIVLAERSSRSRAAEKNGVSKLESHLRSQWRSLFQGMANIWEEEGNQLEASLLPLTDLREKCKTDLELREKCKSDLELINARLSEKR